VGECIRLNIDDLINEMEANKSAEKKEKRLKTWYVLVFMAMTAFMGTINTITATPASTEGPRF